MASSRSKKALRNTGCQLLLELVTAICGLILPRLILSHFGSSYNGITQSISQFISCIALLKSGIGSVTRAALYKPLADRDSRGISEVINATESFMRKIAMIFSAFVLAFAIIYPLIVKKDFSWWFAFTLVLILSISTVAQYFFGITYQMLIEANQNNYIISIVQICSTLVNTLISSVLILTGCSIHMVKLGSAIVFVIPPFFYLWYARRKYGIDKKVPSNDGMISQRWDAFGHQLANFINNNTDIIVTTVFLGLREVSVYSVYNMVANNIKKAVNSISSGTTAAFGNMLAKNEHEILKQRFNQYELLTFGVCTVLFTTTALMFVPFVRVYTREITDVNYSRFGLAVCFCIAEFFACIKLVYENIVFAAGKFKQTKNMAFIEAAINITVSVILANIIGLSGILIGTIVAGMFRTLMYNRFASKEIVHRSSLEICKKFVYTLLCIILCVLIASRLPLNEINNYKEWFLYAIVVFLFTSVIGVVSAFALFKQDSMMLIRMITGTLKCRKKHDV